MKMHFKSNEKISLPVSGGKFFGRNPFGFFKTAVECGVIIEANLIVYFGGQYSLHYFLLRHADAFESNIEMKGQCR